MMLDDVVSHLTPYVSTDLVEVKLPGARTYFNTTVRRLGNHGKRSQKDFEQPTVRNLLKKGTVYQHHDRVLTMLEEWAGPEPIRVWMSDTIPLDFNLHVDHIPEHSVLQVITLCRKRPAIVLSLYEAVGPTPETQTTNTEDNMKELAREFSAEIARYLSASLLNFCHRDFVLLPCALACDGLTKKDLTAEISQQLAYISDFYSGPQRLNLSTFKELSAAMAAVAAVTNAPCFLETPTCQRVWLLLLEDDWHDALSLLIELLVANKKRNVLTYTEESEFKVKAAVMETAKRLSVRDNVLIASSDENLLTCARGMLRQTQADEDVELKLSVFSPGETQPSSQHYICIDQPGTSTTTPSLSVDKEFSLLLLGRKGSGKRSTAHSILGDELFHDNFSMGLFSNTNASKVHWRKRRGIKIHVMESPRLFNGSPDDKTIADARKLVSEIDGGVDAVLCLLHLRSYEQHELRVYNRLREILGKNVCNYVIVVFTHGDLLASKDIKTFLKEAPTEVKQLLGQCYERYAVFDNKTEDTLPQLHMLLEQVRKVRRENKACPYKCPTLSEEKLVREPFLKMDHFENTSQQQDTGSDIHDSENILEQSDTESDMWYSEKAARQSDPGSDFVFRRQESASSLENAVSVQEPDATLRQECEGDQTAPSVLEYTFHRPENQPYPEPDATLRQRRKQTAYKFPEDQRRAALFSACTFHPLEDQPNAEPFKYLVLCILFLYLVSYQYHIYT